VPSAASAEMAAPYVERGTRVNIAKHKLHQIAFEIRRGFIECVGNTFSGLTRNAAEILQTLVITI